MADFFKGLAGGFGTGLQFGQAIRERNMRDELAQAYAKPQEFTDYTPEQQRQIRELQASGAYDVSAVPGAEGVAPTLRYAPRQGLDLQGDVPAEGAYIDVAPQQVQRYGGQTTAGRFDPTQLRGLQMQEAARVLGSYGDVRGAAALQAQAEDQAYQAKYRPLQLQQLEGQIAGQVQQRELTGLQLTDAQRKQRLQTDFDTGFAEINKKTFEKPEDRTAAILNLVEATQGVQAAQALKSSYGRDELDQISLQAKKFDEGFRMSRAKGVIPALEWFDEQNTSFKLERDPKNPFRVIQVNTDGTRSIFADAKNENELGMIIDAKAKPGGFLELAKYDLDVKSKTALNAYYEAKTKEARETGGAAANQLTGVQVGYSRDEKGNPIQVMSGLRFNKKTGALESVQVKLDQNVVPPSALDPKKIADQAEALVGQPIDPTNKKSKEVHTFATAQQAVVDQIFNQYLGTGKPAGGLDLSPAAVAQRMLEGQKPAAAAPDVGLSTAPVERNPYVDARGRPLRNPPEGAPSLASTALPAAVNAVQGALNSQAPAIRYLQAKIARNEPLAPNEQARARQLGLIPSQ